MPQLPGGLRAAGHTGAAGRASRRRPPSTVPLQRLLAGASQVRTNPATHPSQIQDQRLKRVGL